MPGKGFPKMKQYSCAVTTKTGRRHNNQDNYMLAGQYASLDHDLSAAQSSGKTSKPLFAAVADGMGGEASGERASFEACAELSAAAASLGNSFESNKSAIAGAILRANARLCEVMQRENAGRMGSTLVAVLLQGDRLYYTNLGDSRIYLIRGGKLYQLTKDHTEGQAMVDAGVLTQEQLKTHPSRNKLSLHLGIFPDEMTIAPAKYDDIELAHGDRVLLCSDGVYGVMEPEQIVAVMTGAGTAKERSEKLVDTAYANGSRDNMTALVIDVEKRRSLLAPLIIGGIGIAAAAVALTFMIKGLKANSASTDNDGEPQHTGVVRTAAPTDEPADTDAPEQTEQPSGSDEPAPTDAAQTEPEETEAPNN